MAGTYSWPDLSGSGLFRLDPSISSLPEHTSTLPDGLTGYPLELHTHVHYSMYV